MVAVAKGKIRMPKEDFENGLCFFAFRKIAEKGSP